MEPRSSKVLIISESGNSPKAAQVLEMAVADIPRLIAIIGKDCRILEDVCDGFCEKTIRGLDVTTTSHPDESLSQVQEFVEGFDQGLVGRAYKTIRI